MRVILAIILAGLNILNAQTKTECLDCHSDNTLTMERMGKEVSLFVDGDHFKSSVHGSLACTDCHQGFDPDNIPHKEGSNIANVDCAQCHDTEEFASSVHSKKNVPCFSCHSKHEIQPAATLTASQDEFCIKCHKSTDVASYSKSIHFKNFLAGGKAPICTDCHNKSAHKIQAANFTKDSEEKLCASCHRQSHQEFAQSIHNLAKGEHTPGCVDCHGAHEVFNNKYSISSQSCLKCHLDKSNFKSSNSNLVAFVKNYQTSIHAKISEHNQEAATCVDCHDNHLITGYETAKSKIARNNIPATCGKCHQRMVSDFKKSSHGIAFSGGSKLAPVCTDCHGEHTISVMDKSSLTKLQIQKVCSDCHIKNPEVIKASGTANKEISGYENSVHFKAIKAGNENAATCSDCHTGHSSLPASFKQSRINKVNVAATCGSQSGCHKNIKNEYMESIHAWAVKEGIMDAPTCVDCHGNHQVLSKINPKSSVYGNKSVVLLCSSCHADVKLIEKYNIPSGREQTYNESYHGLAVKAGSKYAANCASCHGAHKILPSSDPHSTINRNNLSKTCGKCHVGANINAEFAKVHLTGEKRESALLFWITRLYIALIVLIIGGMLIHNILDFIRKRQEYKKHKKEIKKLKEEGKYYLRMSFNERIQHFIMLSSFIGLVLTGFGLKYPDAWWVVPFRFALGDWAFQTRSIAHRLFGIFMICISFYHLYYLLFTRRGRKLLIDFLPNLKDLKDFIINVKFLLGVSSEKPQFDRFSYMEKAEYWALIWGVFIMSATGLVLMFNNFFLAVTPKIFLDATTLVHLYEAWLATLAIVVWHFYYVIFNPEVYPLNTAFIKGTLSEEEMKHEHPLELEKLNRAENKSSGDSDEISDIPDQK